MILTGISKRLATTDFMDSDPTVWLLLMMYVPVPPDPVPRAVIVVPTTRLPVVSAIVCPTANVPEATAETVKVDPATDPVNDADGLLVDPTSMEMICAHDPRTATGA